MKNGTKNSGRNLKKNVIDDKTLENCMIILFFYTFTSLRDLL